ncbi:MAG: neutral/alkaline non-lysosomal ceramidase N-terminal domain-containing protein [Armatimonadetes bacterium]|nr:neutral/alkaline non-lysosomal ceramidase N-terminal domain-containing protein [Armatimonadota bacterium]
MATRSFRHPHTRCVFGIARRDTTPPVGIYYRNWGASLHDIAEGVHRPFTATAMAFGPLAGDGIPLVFLALDYGWMTASVDTAFRGKLLKACGLEETQLALTLSHTHAGPNASYTSPDTPGASLIQPYLDSLAEKCIDAIREAIRTQAPATITYGVGHCNLAVNRDYFDEDLGETVTGFNPAGEAETTVLVGSVTDGSGVRLATFVNYACHPTTLAWENRLLSPDFVGATREVLEKAFGVPAVFLQGAAGDLNPRDAYHGDVDYADRNGRQLGYAAASALEGLLAANVEMRYEGVVRSGANLGNWGYHPLVETERHRTAKMGAQVLTIELPVKPHPPVSEMRQTMQDAKDRLESLPSETPQLEVRQARLDLELATRAFRRWQDFPDSSAHGFKAWIWRLGEAIFVGVQGEPYSCFQQSLRARFPETPIVVMGVTNGWLAYLCPREVYGRGYYQELICPYQAGSLETVTERVGDEIERIIGE